jgi:hypothetical protein
MAPRKTRALRDKYVGPIPFDSEAASMIARVVSEALNDLRAELLKRITKLEGAHACEWKGVWMPGMELAPGSLITDRGSLWVAVADSNGTRPGDSPAFKLIVKRGRA